MNSSFFFSLHFLWIMLVVANLVIQMTHYYHDQNRTLYLAKRITTPALLFLALLIVVLGSKGFPLVPCVILIAMGIGELGMEGSDVVQPTMENEHEKKKTPILVILAGVLFLLVNVYIGVILMGRNGSFTTILISLLIATLFLSLIFLQVVRAFKPASETRTQMILYLSGIIVLFAGTLIDIYSGLSALGVAAAILTVSDSLVLIRMGANFEKKSASGFRILFLFLVGILLLYYVYMSVLIHIGSPFILG